MASVAWAIDPVNGPIIGERIERYATASAALTLLDTQLSLPCDFEIADGTRWHTERLTPPRGAETSRLFLVTSRDRPDSFNYNAAVIKGSVVVLLSLNSRTENPDLLNEILATALRRTSEAGLTS